MGTLSFWADIASIAGFFIAAIGLPIVYITTHRAIIEYRKAHEPKGVSVETIEFRTSHCGINLVPFGPMNPVPRPQEFVCLPGEKSAGKGCYRVEKVTYIYADDSSYPVGPKLLKVSVVVSPLAEPSLRSNSNKLAAEPPRRPARGVDTAGTDHTDEIV